MVNAEALNDPRRVQSHDILSCLYLHWSTYHWRFWLAAEGVSKAMIIYQLNYTESNLSCPLWAFSMMGKKLNSYLIKYHPAFITLTNARKFSLTKIFVYYKISWCSNILTIFQLLLFLYKGTFSLYLNDSWNAFISMINCRPLQFRNIRILMIDFQKYKHQTPRNNQGWPISTGKPLWQYAKGGLS